MLSIRTLIDRSEPGSSLAETWHKAVLVILEGVSLFAYNYDTVECGAFRAKIGAIRTRFERARNSDEVLELSGSAIRSMESYSAAAEKFECSRVKHLKDTVGILTDSLLQAANGSSESSKRLSRLRTEIEAISGLNNLAAMNTRLRNCLEGVRDEISRQNEHHAQIQKELRRLTTLESGAPDVDPGTGLPGAGAGMQAVRELISGGRSGRLLAFALDRLEAINLRYGFAVGDQILLIFAQHLGQRLQPGENLFRWRGPCFVMLSDRPVPDSVAAAEAARTSATRLEYSVQSTDREITIRIISSWTVVPISPGSSADDVLRKIDEFAIHRAHAQID